MRYWQSLDGEFSRRAHEQPIRDPDHRAWSSVVMNGNDKWASWGGAYKAQTRANQPATVPSAHKSMLPGGRSSRSPSKSQSVVAHSRESKYVRQTRWVDASRGHLALEKPWSWIRCTIRPGPWMSRPSRGLLSTNQLNRGALLDRLAPGPVRVARPWADLKALVRLDGTL